LLLILGVISITIIWLVLWVGPGLWAYSYALRDRRIWRRLGLGPSERALGEQRAALLLRELLEEGEYRQLMRRGYLEVASPNHAARMYRIPRDVGRIRVYEHGRARVDLCVQPVISLPGSDVVLLHKLMIQANEEAYLARANEIPLPLPLPFYGWHIGNWPGF
jgi:hypothetical protein